MAAAPACGTAASQHAGVRRRLSSGAPQQRLLPPLPGRCRRREQQSNQAATPQRRACVSLTAASPIPPGSRGWCSDGSACREGSSASTHSCMHLPDRGTSRRHIVASASGESQAAVGDFFSMLGQMMQQQQQPAAAAPTGAALGLSNMTYQPPGTARPLLQNVDLQLPANKMGLVYGRSGAGKTTLLKIVSGLAQHDSGRVVIGPEAAALAPPADAAINGSGGATDKSSGSNGSSSAGSSIGSAAAAAATGGRMRSSADAGCSNGNSNGAATSAPGVASVAQRRTSQTGLVFQFPERHFLGKTIADELTFGWPARPEDMFARQQLGLRCQRVLDAVGMGSVDLQASPNSLSDGFKRRLALAVQLVRGPSILLLDEPLAGLDWRSRADIADLLGKLKQECTVLVVSHDLHELEQQVDVAWEMLPGGRLVPAPWPPAK